MGVECVHVWVEWMGEGCVISVQVHVQGCSLTLVGGGGWYKPPLDVNNHLESHVSLICQEIEY